MFLQLKSKKPTTGWRGGEVAIYLKRTDCRATRFLQSFYNHFFKLVSFHYQSINNHRSYIYPVVLQVKWMMYWIVFAIFCAAETFADVFLSWWVKHWGHISLRCLLPDRHIPVAISHTWIFVSLRLVFQLWILFFLDSGHTWLFHDLLTVCRFRFRLDFISCSWVLCDKTILTCIVLCKSYESQSVLLKLTFSRHTEKKACCLN